MRPLQSAVTAFLLPLCFINARTSGGQESVIHTFAGADGMNPDASLLLDAKGNLFGTTLSGGSNSAGTVFELSPVSGGGWTERVIHSFSHALTDGYTPQTTLIADAKGNLYGSTLNGGSKMEGTVFEVSPSAGGSWTEKVLYNFGSSATDGNAPIGALVFDTKGNLYGTTLGGPPGPNDVNGTVYELTPPTVPEAGGAWTETVLYVFGTSNNDGASPQAGLAIDAVGALYGTTYSGGSYAGGTVYKLTQAAGGLWTETILHDFIPSPSGPLGYPEISGDGSNPESNLILDSAGNLYGTTANGTTIGTTGPAGIGNGTVYELLPTASGGWTETVSFLYTDHQSPSSPVAGVTMDSAGNVYGTSPQGGSYFGMVNGSGSTVFEVLPSQAVLHNFPSNSADGYGIYGSGVIFDSYGNLYGATSYGGSNGFGTIFEIAGVGPSTPVGTTISLSANPGSGLVAGEPITLTATVTADSGPAIPTGTVTFADPAGGSVVALLVAGQAVYSGKVPPVGSYSVYASYSGGGGFSPSASATVTGCVTASSQGGGSCGASAR